MDQSKLSRSLKLILLGVGVCGLIVFGYILPACAISVRDAYPEYARAYWPWLGFLWLAALPCYGVLVLGWRIAANIGADRSFCRENARMLRGVAWLAAGDTAYFFLGNAALLLLNMSHPGVVLASLLVCFAGVAVTVAAVCLSHLVQKAAELQEQSDLTI